MNYVMNVDAAPYCANTIKIISRFSNGVVRLPVSLYELREIIGVIRNEINNNGHNLDSIELYLVDDREQAEINLKFLGCTGPTNIISFPDTSGLLSFSITTFLRETILYGQNPLVYLLTLLTHGMVHLAGYEHGELMDNLCEKCVRKALADFA